MFFLKERVTATGAQKTQKTVGADIDIFRNYSWEKFYLFTHVFHKKPFYKKHDTRTQKPYNLII